MRSLFAFVLLAAPGLAFAGDPAPPPPPPGGTYAPATGNPPYTAPPPSSPPPATGTPYGSGTGPYAPPPPNTGGPAYGPGYNTQPYGQQPQPQPYLAPPPSLRNGMTFEANLGIGWIRIAADGESETSDLGIGGLCLGVGGWISEKTAITGRLSGVTLSENGETGSAIFLGPSAQYWIDDHFWAGGGAGFGIIASSDSDETITGFGLDFRVGYTFTAGSESTFNASFELTPGFYEEGGFDFTFTGIALMVGYQHL